MRRAAGRGRSCWLGIALMMLGARAQAARDNLALWQQQPAAPALAAEDEVALLARTHALYLGLQIDPRLLVARLEGPAQYRYGVAAYLFASRSLERRGYGLSWRVDDLALQAASVDLAAPAARPTVGHLGRLSVQAAEAEARRYGPTSRISNFFVGASAGVYRAGLTLERVGAGTRVLDAWPLTAAAGVGYGRILPHTPRVALAHLERMLAAEGIIDAPLSEAARRQVMLLWMAHAGDLGEQGFVVATMAALQRAGAVRGPMVPAAAYRLERIVAVWVRRPAMPRFVGTQGWLALRGSSTAGPRAERPIVLSVELRGRGVRNLSLTSAVWLEPTVAWAPRARDRGVAGPEAGLQASALAPPAAAPLLARSAPRLLLAVPARYDRIFIDAADQARGAMSLQAGLAASWRHRLEAEASAGAAYTFFFSGTQGVKVGLSAAAATTERGREAQLQVVAGYLQGSGYGAYTMPGPVPSAALQSRAERGP